MTKGEQGFPPPKQTEARSAETPREGIERLRKELTELEYRAAHPGETAFKVDIEPEVLKREAELRALEKSVSAPTETIGSPSVETPWEGIERLRKELAELEYQASHPGQTPFKDKDLEKKVDDRERKLHALEKSVSAPAETDSEPMVSQEKEISEALSPRTWRERRDSALTPQEEGSVRPMNTDRERYMPSFSANPEDALDPKRVTEILGTDRTPEEWRKKLAELILKAAGEKEIREEGGKETGERVISMQKYLDKRNEEIEAEGEKFGTTGNPIHSVDTKYRNFSWKKKLALVASLVLSTSAVSFPEMMRATHQGSETPHVVMGPITPVPSSRLTMEEINEFASPQSLKEVPHVVMGPITPVPPVEMPVIEASPHGYEGMLKQLWTQLHNKHMTLPANAGAESDLAKLLAADAKTLDSVVHRIAADSRHAFFHADGTSVLIPEGAHMTIGPDGNVQLNGSVHAPIDAPVTPAFHTELPPIEASAVSPVAEDVTPSIAPVSIPSEQVILPITSSDVPPVSAEHVVLNTFGIEVSPTEPHLYADKANHIFVFGGSPAERMKVLVAYVTKHPDTTVFDTDIKGLYRIPWHFVDGKILPEEPVRTRGFLGFGSSWMKAPNPSEFRKIIQ